MAFARRLVAHILDEDGDIFARWRARLIASALLVSVSVGVVPFAVTIRVLASEGRGWLVVLHLLANALLWWLLLSRWPSNRLRSMMLVSACFLVGAISLFTMGFVSAALVWLFASILLGSLLLGVGCTVATVASALVLLVGAGLAVESGRATWLATQPAIADRWLMITLNFLFVTFVCAIGNAIVLHVLTQQEQRRRALEARLAEARHHEALGTLASGIAHDFNNLLVPIAHGLEGLRADGRTDRATHEVLDDAISSATVARDLVRRILGFARQTSETRESVPLAPIVRAVCGRITARHRVHVTSVLDESLHVHGNAAELHQVVDNLLDNAVRAVQTGGAVSVTLTVTPFDDTPWVQLVVRDTGRGMSADTVARVFEPYFTTRTVGQGTGLGLPIVRSIVTGLGGRIAVQSAPGRGTAFEVLLPRVEAAVPAPLPDDARRITPTGQPAVVDASRSADEAAPSLVVLLVDDEPLVRRAVSRQLQQLGHTVVVGSSVDEAEQLLATTPCDVVLTDWRMPGRDGLALARAEAYRARGCPLVLMSGDVESARSSRDWLAGAVALQKPFTSAELDAALRTAMARTRRNARTAAAG